MTNHKAAITANAEGSFYALIVRVDRDGSEHVIHGYKGRQFATRAAAEKSIARYLSRSA